MNLPLDLKINFALTIGVLTVWNLIVTCFSNAPPNVFCAQIFTVCSVFGVYVFQMYYSSEVKRSNPYDGLISVLNTVVQNLNQAPAVNQVLTRRPAEVQEEDRPIKYFLLPETEACPPISLDQKVIEIYSSTAINIPGHSSGTIQTGLVLMLPPGVIGLITPASENRLISVRTEILSSTDRTEVRILVQNNSNEIFHIRARHVLARILIIGGWNGRLVNHLE